VDVTAGCADVYLVVEILSGGRGNVVVNGQDVSALHLLSMTSMYDTAVMP
jgi:hypothetical protein